MGLFLQKTLFFSSENPGVRMEDQILQAIELFKQNTQESVAKSHELLKKVTFLLKDSFVPSLNLILG